MTYHTRSWDAAGQLPSSLRDIADLPAASIGRSTDPPQCVDEAIKGRDRTRDWYRRRAERAEELANQVFSPENRNRLLQVAAQLRTNAISASTGAAQPPRLGNVQRVDLWRRLSTRLGIALSAVGGLMKRLDAMGQAQ